MKKLAEVVSVVQPSASKATQEKENTEQDRQYHISENCSEQLSNLEKDIGNNSNGMPILIEILKTVKKLESNNNFGRKVQNLVYGVE